MSAEGGGASSMLQSQMASEGGGTLDMVLWGHPDDIRSQILGWGDAEIADLGNFTPMGGGSGNGGMFLG